MWAGNVNGFIGMLEANMDSAPLTQTQLLRLVAKRLLVVIPALFALIFIPAGTLDYWEAWLYLAILFAPMIFVLLYLLKNDPELLERRMRIREKETQQKQIMYVGVPLFILIYMLPGLDKRFGWSDTPAAVVLLADLFVLLGYALIFIVFRANSYAARTIAVDPGQKVISSGPYAFVRHPMYLGALLLYILSPLALGSYWGMIPTLLLIPLFVSRIRSEENVLTRDLTGYAAYRQKVRYRLLPGVW